jgi:hypothetical protein
MTTAEPRTRLDGAIEMATQAIDGGVAAIEGVHGAIARRPFAALGVVPGIAEVAEVVRTFHDGISALAYGGVRAGLGLVGGVARLAAAVAPIEDREPRPGSAAGLGIAALNGFAGDRLAARAHPLAEGMALRHRGRALAAERGVLASAFPGATGRLAIFVHGLACNESGWRFYSERHYGDRRTSYGSRLAADLGYTPLYVRYNSGLHISENGVRLSDLLESLVADWPVAAEEIALIGHSMGGLVLRSACQDARVRGLRWVAPVRHLVLLGSPHSGAPLEKIGNVAGWMLDRFDGTRGLAAFLNRRSAGIKDLRFGALVDGHWRGTDLDELLVDRTDGPPFLEDAAHYFVAATITRSAQHPLGALLGDGLVREPSASGRLRLKRHRPPRVEERHFGGLGHMALLNHPDVYEQIRHWLAG